LFFFRAENNFPGHFDFFFSPEENLPTRFEFFLPREKVSRRVLFLDGANQDSIGRKLFLNKSGKFLPPQKKVKMSPQKIFRDKKSLEAQKNIFRNQKANNNIGKINFPDRLRH
jgi:hypothetical protein